MTTRNSLLRKIGSLPPPTKLVLEDQDAYDIMRRMMLKHKSCGCDYDKISEDFDFADTYTVCNKLWEFCKNNLDYQEESANHQFISSPQTLLTRGYCDCKGYALFIGGVLDSLNRHGHNIKWQYRFASDNPKTEIPGHVFIVVNDDGNEIWIDPVLNQFNQSHYFPYYEDKKIKAPAKVAGCGCGCAGSIGATTAQTGQMIIKIAPLLATVPVVGWVAGAAAEVIGGIISVVGSKWNQSPDVRWLAQLFEFFALGNKTATSDNKISEADVPTAQAFFSIVLGVPIGGRKDFNILQSGDGNTNTPTNQTAQQRAQNYLNWKGLPAGSVSLDQATQAANIAAGLNPQKFSAGSWAALTPATSTISKDPETSSTLYVNPSGSLTDSATGGGSIATGSLITDSHKKILILAALVGAAFLIIK